MWKIHLNLSLKNYNLLDEFRGCRECVVIILVRSRGGNLADGGPQFGAVGWWGRVTLIWVTSRHGTGAPLCVYMITCLPWQTQYKEEKYEKNDHIYKMTFVVEIDLNANPASAKWWYNAGLGSATMVQERTNIGSTSGIFFEPLESRHYIWLISRERITDC